jgi:hypothetical protein
VEARHDNHLRNSNIEYHVYFPELPAIASGTRFFQTVLDPAVGAEVVLVLVDQTDFAYELARRSPFELHLKTGAVRTSFGPLSFLLWWATPLTDGMPFAMYEHLLNPTEHDLFEMVRTLSVQTHFHVLLIGPEQELLDCYEFESTFKFDAVLPIIESAVTGPALDLEAAKREYERMYDLKTLFQMEPSREHTDERGEDGRKHRANSNAGMPLIGAWLSQRQNWRSTFGWVNPNSLGRRRRSIFWRPAGS